LHRFDGALLFCSESMSQLRASPDETKGGVIMLGELQPWFAEMPSLERFRREMEKLLDRFFSEIGHRSPVAIGPAMSSLESFFRDGQWVMRFDLPGVDPKDIDVSIAGNTLTVAHRASGELRTVDQRCAKSPTADSNAC
jgi:HSP20 family molecular chaperone IbpA